MSREDIIPIKNGTIETEDGKTVEVGGGWFLKEPSEDMKKYYESSDYWNGTWGGSSPDETSLNVADTRWRLYKKLYHGAEW